MEVDVRSTRLVTNMLQTWQGAAKLPTIPHDIASQKSEIAMSLSVCPRAVGLLQHAVIRLCQILEKILVCLYVNGSHSTYWEICHGVSVRSTEHMKTLVH